MKLKKFSAEQPAESQLVIAEVDLERITQERMRQNSFGQSMQRYHEELGQFRSIEFHSQFPMGHLLERGNFSTSIVRAATTSA